MLEAESVNSIGLFKIALVNTSLARIREEMTVFLAAPADRERLEEVLTVLELGGTNPCRLWRIPCRCGQLPWAICEPWHDVH